MAHYELAYSQAHSYYELDYERSEIGPKRGVFFKHLKQKCFTVLRRRIWALLTILRKSPQVPQPSRASNKRKGNWGFWPNLKTFATCLLRRLESAAQLARCRAPA